VRYRKACADQTAHKRAVDRRERKHGTSAPIAEIEAVKASAENLFPKVKRMW
jgi:hypothetical protein